MGPVCVSSFSLPLSQHLSLFLSVSSAFRYALKAEVVCCMQVDTVLSRLTALKERIEGTEALIEIDLDHRRNELVAFDLVRPMFTYTADSCDPCVLYVNAVCSVCSEHVASEANEHYMSQ